MRKPTFVYQLTLSVVLASCTKAEFVEIYDARPPDKGSDGPADATPPASQCEDPAKTVCVNPSTTGIIDCPDMCHTTAGQPAGAACEPGTAADTCAPGNVCLETSNASNTFICFKLCTDSTGCGPVACAARFMSKTTWVKVCDLPYDSCSTGCCDPLDTSSVSGKCGNNICYLVAPLRGSPDSRTVCEYSSGDLKDVVCVASRDCVPGYACWFPPTSFETGICKQVCRPGDPKACPSCTPYNNQYGVCTSS